ncbi:ABC transporter ATP-binding protein [Brevundimonas lutea]|uniref:ABC transporter ATP-binding protein n=1 Tax=Brevundimonas lutea TaxID=2293980 RepID=UPI000F020618|nr:ABC transporter ATP-binding protein [Brevundimonas lutea]
MPSLSAARVDPEAPPLAVAATGVVRRFGRASALRDLTLSLPSGSCCVLVGANGAGKSTFLRVLQGIQSRDAGDLRVLGLDPAIDGARIRANTGYVREDTNLGHRWTTVGRLVDHHRAYYRAWDEAYAALIVRRLNIDLKRRVGQLSKGQARRVQLLLALAHRPALLLLDEPTDGLDPVIRDDALALLAEHLADTGCATLISTHLVHEIKGLADRVALINAGRVSTEQSLDDLQASLRECRGRPPSEDWSPPADLQSQILSVDRLGLERRWILRDDAGRGVERLRQCGVSVTDVRTLSLEQTVLVLLRAETPR